MKSEKQHFSTDHLLRDLKNRTISSGFVTTFAQGLQFVLTLASTMVLARLLPPHDFGLVAITRKRVKQSLERTLSVQCTICQGTGMVKSPATVCNEIYIELRKMKRHFESADVMLRVNPETVKVLKANNGSWINEFEELVGKNILIKSDPTLHPEQFDIQG